MKFSLQIFRTIVVSGLIFLLGSIIQYRYNYVVKLPIVSKTTQDVTYQDVKGTTLTKLLDTDVPAERKEIDFSVFWQAWNILEEEYNEPDKMDSEKMVDGAIGGMVASLGDPYTAYLPPEDKVRSGEDLAGAFFGVGIELGYVDGVLAVVSPLDGTPAAAAGVQAGDLILRVKDTVKKTDEATTGWALSEAVDRIRGPKGSEVILTMYRKDKAAEPYDVPLLRQEIVVKSVELKFVEEKGKRVAHIRLSRFGERTQAEWMEAVQTILKEKGNIKGIVLDMRNDPGGFFDEAIRISSDFITSGPIVIQKGRFSDQTYNSNGSARLVGIPLVVLVNGGSASASEIVAGALRDRLSAKMIGQKTFGKGTVQDRRELKNGGGIHVTIARWMLPGGAWIHEQGIPVDVEVQDDPATVADEMLIKAIETL